ncbi:MAG: sensor histidine kinase [Bacteroidota bacterium]
MKNRKFKYLTFLIYPLAGLLALLLAQAFNSSSRDNTNAEQLLKEVNRYLKNAFHESSTHAAAFTKAQPLSPEILFEKLENGDFNKLHKKGIYVCFYSGKKASFWSNAAVIENHPGISGLSSKINGGWYVKYLFQHPNGTLVYYVLIKQEYPIDNKYLGDTYPEALSKFGYGVYHEALPAGIKITHPSFNKAFFLLPKVAYKNGPWLASFLCILLFIYALTKWFSLIRKQVEIFFGEFYSWIIYLMLMLGFRSGISFFDPFSMKEFLEVFHPSYYATGINPSLGDFIISLFMLYRIGLEMHHSKLLLNKKKQIHSLISLFFLLSVHLMAIGGSKLLSSLISDSNINLDFDYLFAFNAFSFMGWLIAGMVFLTFHEFASMAVKQAGKAETVRDFFLVTLSVSFTVALIVYFSGGKHPEVIIFSSLYVIFHRLFDKDLFRQENISRSIIFLLLFSLWGAWVFSKEIQNRTNERAIILAEKISGEKDGIAEFLFNEMSGSIEEDSIIVCSVGGNEKDYPIILKRLQEKYLNGYWEKFDSKIYVYDTTCRLVTKSVNAEFERLDFFEKIYTHSENYSGIPNLYYIPGEGDETRGLLATYKLNVPLKGRRQRLSLFIELTSKFNYNTLGYPSLLIDKRFTLPEEFKQLSYATYKNNLLVNAFGENRYIYPFKATFIPHKLLNGSFFEYKGTRHYYTKSGKDRIFIVSHQPVDTRKFFSLSSLLFIIFGVLLTMAFFLRGDASDYYKRLKTLKTRIRLIVIGLVVIALTGFGIITIFYLINHYRQENQQYVYHQLESINAELQNRIGDENYLSKSNSDYNNYILTKVSGLFGNDLNLYDTTGCITSSSKINLFEEKLLPPRMQPMAYSKLILNKEPDFSQDEEIGNLPYTSYYIQVRNNNNKLLGFLQLPVFDTQEKLEKEVINLLMILLTIYVLVFVAATLFSLWISNRITIPLSMLGDRFSNLSLSNTNQPIHYPISDEIGSLISVYNNMLKELEEKATRLAQKEREGAWKEMARQVAHEIKNPLTPMKLSVQHLQKSLHENDLAWKERFMRVSDTLIEQIDSLNRIADEFSMFASLEKSIPERVSLSALLASVAELHKNQGIPIHLHGMKGDQSNIIADKNQMLRIFNNLIKNALQSMDENKEGCVDIELIKLNNNEIKIEIRDNGIGIPQEDYDKIFKPNFTTKSGGTGLGLAMVKKLTEQNNGSIGFSSSPGKGSIFFLTFNLA